MMAASASVRSSGERAFTDPWVPTGIKTGVSKLP